MKPWMTRRTRWWFIRNCQGAAHVERVAWTHRKPRGCSPDAMRAGHHDEAQQLWGEVLSADVEHPQALFHLGQHALMRKDTGRARQLLQRAAKAAPREPAIPLNLSFVHRATGDAAAEMTALTDALAIDPYFFPALLAKGMLLERTGEKRKAARVYKDVLTIAPPEEQVAAELRGPLRRAREAVDENAAELDAYLRARLDPVVSRHEDENLSRFEECRDIALDAGKSTRSSRACCTFRVCPRSSSTNVPTFRGCRRSRPPAT